MSIPEGFYPIINCGLKEGYYINKVGVVASTLKGTFAILKSRVNNRNYVDVPLARAEDGKRRPYNIHRLMALTFLDNPEGYPVTNHINGIKHDNRLSNLEWCSISYNTKHAYDVCGAVNGRQRTIKATIVSTGESHIFDSAKHASEYFDVPSPDVYNRVGGRAKNPSNCGQLRGIHFEYLT